MKTRATHKNNGFSLIEILMVIAIIAVMAALVINAFSNAANDSRDTVARQQQAALQSALSSWIGQQVSSTQTISQVKAIYTAGLDDDGNVGNGSSAHRLNLIKDYLDDRSYDHFKSYTSDATKVRSAAMVKVKKFISLSDWPAVSAANRAPYPKVELTSD